MNSDHEKYTVSIIPVKCREEAAGREHEGTTGQDDTAVTYPLQIPSCHVCHSNRPGWAVQELISISGKQKICLKTASFFCPASGQKSTRIKVQALKLTQQQSGTVLQCLDASSPSQSEARSVQKHLICKHTDIAFNMTCTNTNRDKQQNLPAHICSTRKDVRVSFNPILKNSFWPSFSPPN